MGQGETLPRGRELLVEDVDLIQDIVRVLAAVAEGLDLGRRRHNHLVHALPPELSAAHPDPQGSSGRLAPLFESLAASTLRMQRPLLDRRRFSSQPEGACGTAPFVDEFHAVKSGIQPTLDRPNRPKLCHILKLSKNVICTENGTFSPTMFFVSSLNRGAARVVWDLKIDDLVFL